MPAILLATALAILLLRPESAAAIVLHRYLVAWPAATLARMERRHLIFLIVLLGMMFAVETVLLMGSADIAMLFAWDVSLYLDVALATWTLATVARVKTVVTMLRRPRDLLPARSPRPRQPRSHRRAQRPPSANDDDRPGAMALAA